MSNHLILPGLALIVCGVGCGPPPAVEDTCAPDSESEANMANPRLADGIVENDDGSYEFVLTWDAVEEGPAAELPSDYFENVRLAVPASEEAEDRATASLTAAREITITLPSLFDLRNASDELLVNLSFEDRKHFIDCSHGGTDDEYVVRVLLTVLDTGEVTDFSITQERLLGGY